MEVSQALVTQKVPGTELSYVSSIYESPLLGELEYAHKELQGVTGKIGRLFSPATT
jgi:hypothetical protein